MISRFIVSICLLGCLGLKAHARQCGRIFYDESFAGPPIAESLYNPRASHLLKFIEGRLSPRYGRDLHVENLTVELSRHQANEEPQAFKVTWPSVTAGLYKRRRKNTLVYGVSSVIAHSGGHALNYGSRPQHLNLGFSKFLLSIFEALRIDLQNDPSLRRVELEATTVVNKELVRLLEDYGFIERPKATTPSASRTVEFEFSPHYSPGGIGRFGMFEEAIAMDSVSHHRVPQSGVQNFAKDWFLPFSVRD